MSVPAEHDVDIVETLAIDVLEHPDRFMVRHDGIASLARVFRLWRFPPYDAYQSWHFYREEGNDAPLVLQTLIWNRQIAKNTAPDAPPRPVIHSALVHVADKAFSQHLKALFSLEFTPCVMDLTPQMPGVTTGLAVAGNAWTKLEWYGDGPPQWKELDRWAEKAIELLTVTNRLAKFDTVELINI